MLILGKRYGEVKRIWEVSKKSDSVGKVVWCAYRDSTFPLGSMCPLYHCLEYWEFFPVTKEELTMYMLGGA